MTQTCDCGREFETPAEIDACRAGFHGQGYGDIVARLQQAIDRCDARSHESADAAYWHGRKTSYMIILDMIMGRSSRCL
jgi:hypothetical protein